MSMVLILGAKSDIAKALAYEYAANGYDLCLAARNITELVGFAKNLEIRYEIKVVLKEFDAEMSDSHTEFYNSLPGSPFGVIYCAGYMVEQNIAETVQYETQRTINVNYSGAVSILNIIANDFSARKSGFIIGISSVAGDRGRGSNYIYGSAKAAFTAYLSGLRNRLHNSGVSVLTVKPGFVRTKMTAGLKLPALLTAEPEQVAKDVVRAWKKGRSIVYTRWFWRYIMLIIKIIPELVFKRMRL